MRGSARFLTAHACLTALCGWLLLGGAVEAGAAIPPGERAALIALYSSTNGAGWHDHSNWRNATDTDFAPAGTECTWYGVWCDDIGDYHRLVLHLENNRLAGTLPPEIGNLTALYRLILDNNQLTGALPPEIGNLTALEDVSLSNNQLSGSIPPEIGHLPHLVYLSLANNQLTGPIPSTLAHGIYLFLDHNQLSGPIPPEIGAVQVLSLSNNQLTGSIPATIFRLISLVELRLDHNQLSGPIPPEIGNFIGGWDAYYVGRILRLDHNQLSGPIPPEIGKVVMGSNALGSLHLDHNQLSGPIPAEIGSVRNLGRLFLNNNQLTGPIPSQIGNLGRLDDLDLSGNQLSGPIPPQLGTLGLLSALHLQGNQLGGPIPATLTNMTGLVDGSSDLRWNALHTSDAALQAFLDSKQVGGDWEGTQTVAPAGLTAGSAALDSIQLSWSPIHYTGDTGGYRMWYATQAGGPYNLAGTTVDKAVSASLLGGLSPGTTYYFALDTVTEPHANNQNTVASGRSAEVSAGTTAGGVGWHGLTVVRYGPGTVSSGEIACGGVCSATFAPGTPITLAAAPDAGSTFLGWGGACAGTALTCGLTMGSAQTVTATFSTPAVSFYTVTPCRLYDSRDAGLGGPAALAADTDNAVLVEGYCGVPATATAVSLNMTVVSPSTGGHLRLYASDAPRPATSSVNYAPGQTRANNAVVSLGADGALMVYVSQPSGTMHLVIDVNGYFQ